MSSPTSISWHKQGSEPLFAELDWNKPERRDQAGSLLIVGGSQQALNAPAQAFSYATHLGIGSAKVALPDKTRPLLQNTGFEAIFLPSTPSGEFSRDGLSTLLEYSSWSDTILLCGDIGRNSQTSILLSDLLNNYHGPLVITRDALDTLQNEPATTIERPNTTIISTIAQLQKLFKNYNYPQAVQFNMDLPKLISILQDITSRHNTNIVTLHNNQFVVAASGEASTTALTSAAEPINWRLPLAIISSCRLTWHHKDTFRALTHSVFTFSQN